MIDILKSAVYCGTYGKYNAGRIDGGWLKLGDYPTYDEYIKGCKNLHKDEANPEFMYQDTEHLPDEFYSESLISPEVFDVIRTIKKDIAKDQKKTAAFEAFCEDTAAIPDMFDVDEFLLTYKADKRSSRPNDNKDLKEFKEKFKDWYYVNYIVDVIKIDDEHYITFEKQEMEKSFCFGYSNIYGPTSEEANKACENFGEKEFKERNLNKFDHKYERVLKHLEKHETVMLRLEYAGCGMMKNYGAEIVYIETDEDAPLKNGDIISLSTEDSNRIRESYKKHVQDLRQAFEKRLDTYLKKYGMSKIRKWTYWADE